MSPRAVVEEQQQARRSQLIRATFQEVSAKGFSNVTLEDIAARAGLSKGVALYYFDSKEALFLAAFERSISALGDRLKAAVAAARGPVEQIRAVMRTTFVGVRENCEFYRAYLDFLSLGTRHQEFQQLNATFYRNCLFLESGIIKAGVEQGVFRLGSDAAVPRAVFDGFMLQWLFDRPETFEEYYRRCEDAVLRYLQR